MQRDCILIRLYRVEMRAIVNIQVVWYIGWYQNHICTIVGVENTIVCIYAYGHKSAQVVSSVGNIQMNRAGRCRQIRILNRKVHIVVLDVSIGNVRLRVDVRTRPDITLDIETIARANNQYGESIRRNNHKQPRIPVGTGHVTLQKRGIPSSLRVVSSDHHDIHR